jgi:nanoRNase/pAp phosphatase (c-di-AMP/oligoRNAs hydrolase)
MRLVTRSDFDGLVCGMLLMKKNAIDSWKFVHPKDLQDGLFEASENDILANVPYVEGCGMWFDHHASEQARLGDKLDVPGKRVICDSAAHIIYDYYGGEEAFPGAYEMIMAIDKVDSAKLSIDEILNPTGWVLIGFLTDPRTGLGRFRDFTVPNYKLMEELLIDCNDMSADEILALPDMVERVELYNEQSALFKKMLQDKTQIFGNVIVTDLRDVDVINAGNRFMIYSLFPEQNVSLWVVDGRGKVNVSIATGYSVINRTCDKDIGSLMLSYDGGGHKQVGTCQVAHDDADKVIKQIVDHLFEK